MSSMRVIYKPEAIKEYRKIKSILKRKRPGHVPLFTADVNKTIELIFAIPQGFPEVASGIRKCRLSKFKSVTLYYEMEPGLMVIYSVFDSRRDPQELDGRF